MALCFLMSVFFFIWKTNLKRRIPIIHCVGRQSQFSLKRFYPFYFLICIRQPFCFRFPQHSITLFYFCDYSFGNSHRFHSRKVKLHHTLHLGINFVFFGFNIIRYILCVRISCSSAHIFTHESFLNRTSVTKCKRKGLIYGIAKINKLQFNRGNHWIIRGCVACNR